MSKQRSPALISFLLNIQDRVAGTPGNFFMEDLYCFLFGGTGYIVVNHSQTPAGGGLVIVPPTIGTNTSVFLVDLGVKQAADYSPLVWVPSSPAAGQYTINNSTGAYSFNSSDTSAKLVTYGFYVGPYPPQILFITSGARTINYSGVAYRGGRDVAVQGLIDRSKVRTSVGVSVDNVDVTLRALPSMQINNNIPIITAFQQGYFDGAAVLVQRLFMPSYGDISLGSVIQFKGTIGDITKIGRASVDFEIRSRTELFNTPLPRNILGPSCRHSLFDGGCLLSENALTVSGAVQSGSNVSTIITNLTQPVSSPGPTIGASLSVVAPAGVNLNARIEWVVQTLVNANGESLPGPEVNSGPVSGAKLIQVASPSGAIPSGTVGWNCYIGDAPGDEQLQNGAPIPIGTAYTENVNGFTNGSPPPVLSSNGYFSLGVITFTSGLNQGIRRVCTTYTNNGSNNVVNIIPPLPNAPSSGDTFVISPGCDQRQSTCTDKFGNLIHFGGQPFIPDPTAIV